MFLTTGSMGCLRMDFNAIQCINIKSGQTFKFALQNLDEDEGESKDILNHEHFDKMYFGECIQQNVTLPTWILNKYKDNDNKPKDIDSRHRYNILYRIAGAYGKNLKLSKTANCIIYNAEQLRQSTNDKAIINGYYVNLPELQQPLTSVTSIIDNQKNKIYTIGRSEYGKNYIYDLDLECAELEWNRNEGILTKKIFGSSLTIINKTNYNQNNNDTILMCGGRNINRNIINDVNILNLTSKTIINMKAMNHKRAYFNCVSYKGNNTFIVGGGYEGCKTLEVFDIIKDEWMIIPQETNYSHEYNSCLWIDNCNQNIVYCCGKKLGYDQLDHLGYIEFCDLREDTNKFKIFKNAKIASLFNIKGINDKWESRSMFI